MARPVVIVLVVAVVAVVLDRLALAAEARGWIRYRRSPPSQTSVSSALMSVQALFEPDRAHVVEQRHQDEADIDVAGDRDPHP